MCLRPSGSGTSCSMATSLNDCESVAGKWLATQTSFAALQLAAFTVVHVGRRQDLQILSVPFEPTNAADVLRADTTFAVQTP